MFIIFLMCPIKYETCKLHITSVSLLIIKLYFVPFVQFFCVCLDVEFVINLAPADDGASDVARPLSYKTKTRPPIFSRPRPRPVRPRLRPRSLFLKTIKLLTEDHWR